MAKKRSKLTELEALLAAQQPFDAESGGYDYANAIQAGMAPSKKDAHWGSLRETTEEERKRLGLPDESYLLLKGRQHETWDLAEEEEKRRGFKIIKVGDRYFSVPNAN